MDYGEVLRKTWQITWRYKGLWILGILAGCSASGTGSSGRTSANFRGFNVPAPNGNGGAPPPPGEFPLPPNMQEFFQRGFEALPGWVLPTVIALCCVLLILSVIFLILGVIGQGGLIASFARADEGASVSLSEGWQLGLQNFSKVFGIRLIVWLIGLAVGLVLLIFVISTFGLGLLCLIPLACLGIPLGIAIDAYVILSMIAAIDENLGLTAAFSRVWEVLRVDFVPFLLMTLILVFGGAIVGTLLVLPFIAIFLPLIPAMIAGTETALRSGLLVTALCGVAALPVIILLNGIITTYITGAWTLTYRRMTGRPGQPLIAA